MYSNERSFEIMRFEEWLGHTHKCECGKSFCAHEDGCPECGEGAYVFPLDDILLSDLGVTVECVRGETSGPIKTFIFDPNHPDLHVSFQAEGEFSWL